MSESEKQHTPVLVPEKYQGLGAFPLTQATVTATQYGSEQLGLAREDSPNRQLRYSGPAYGVWESGIQIPVEQSLFRNIAFYGKNESLPGDLVLRLKVEHTRKLAHEMADLPWLQDEVLAIRSIAEKIEARRVVNASDYIEAINHYLTTDLVVEHPFFAIVGTTPQPKTEQYSEGYVKIQQLAQVAAIDFTENGTLLSLLRRQDGELGYKLGRLALFR